PKRELPMPERWEGEPSSAFLRFGWRQNAGVSENPGSRAAQGPFHAKEPIVRREDDRGKHISNIWQIQRWD
ncbi:MAG: hypothetical protein M3Q09_11340, partial [Gemmatimonadota bacterium]|nr:hypothetical protein [Gemmatimonadota bacterium]